MEKNYTSSQPKPDKKNPSRKECEEIITRILNAEITERGRNMQFRNSRDFLPYFESLYPASDSLTKQVQRALRNLSLAKDSSGFLIINKNAKQIQRDSEITRILSSNTAPVLFQASTPVFLEMESPMKEYMYELLSKPNALSSLYTTVLSSSNGLLFYSENAELLLKVIQLSKSLY